MFKWEHCSFSKPNNYRLYVYIRQKCCAVEREEGGPMFLRNVYDRNHKQILSSRKSEIAPKSKDTIDNF